MSETILLDEMLKRKVSQNEAFEFFDHLEGVEPQEILRANRWIALFFCHKSVV